MTIITLQTWLTIRFVPKKEIWKILPECTLQCYFFKVAILFIYLFIYLFGGRREVNLIYKSDSLKKNRY